jgi:membrane protein DedA with SNARE-associated domain
MGSLAGDQLYFFIGRLRGRAFLTKRPTWQQRIDKVYHLLERYHTPIILGFRFMYGLRTVIPFAIGMSQIKTGNFIILNVVGALVWAIVVGTLGYMFGAALEVIITDIEHYELEVITGICIIGILMWTLHFYRRKRLNGKKR